jgi:hypothetical protein
MSDAELFITTYTPADCHRIAFASNGKFGSELRDDNRMFRTEIAKSLIQCPKIANDDLIRDLYDAETSYSKDSFGVYHQFVSCLASQLLERGGEINISHYLACVFRGQDAYFSSQCVSLTKEARYRAIATIDFLIERSNGDVPLYYQGIRDNLAQTPES